MAKSKKFYAVARGRNPGIYTEWFGPGGAEEQIRAVKGARYKGFSTREEAERWLGNPSTEPLKSAGKAERGDASVTENSVIVYTDGGALGNPGPGGYGAVIIDGDKRTELSQGFRLTTNNRMELAACIAALKTLKKPSDVVLYSDSSYVVNGITKGWAGKWRANNWMRTKDEAALNPDLWARLLELVEFHRVRFVWVRGHAGNRENERCDELARKAAAGPGKIEDKGYIRK
ncbi:MAG: ribonuclease HI [Syntrophales bacterium]|jgi:ribonuclease HI|nr:ribonuclease HI [Syntrophales bacterium]MDY0043030.1 ribonuclease HI [Syntrophales bacterium]